MSEALGITEATFHRKYARRVNGHWSLNEHESPYGMDCVFLTRDAEGRSGCRLYAARPVQCRTWPFWPENLESRESWESVKQHTPCPGMGAGSLVTVESILERLNATPEDGQGGSSEPPQGH